uniref:Uncharacterized protein n=1 Tax=mine drainage metagenome TaxID=410659 RepID=E6QKJ2_9ZZZZ
MSAGSAACRVVDEPVGTHDAHLPLVALHVPQRYVAAPGLEVSPGDVLKNLLVQAEFGHQTLQLPVLLLQFLQSLRLVHLQAAILLTPSVVRLLRDSGLPACYWVRLSVRYRHFDLPQNVHNLLRRVLPCITHSMLLPYQLVSSQLVQNLPGTPVPIRQRAPEAEGRSRGHASRPGV